MLHWLPAEPGSGHSTHPQWDQGPAPHRGSWPNGQSRRAWALLQEQPAEWGVGRRRQEGQPLPSAHTFLSWPAPQLAALCRMLCSTGPWLHQHFPAAVPPGPLCLLCFKQNASPVSCPMAWPSQLDPQDRSPKLPCCRHGLTGTAPAGSRQGRAQGVRGTCCMKWGWEEENGMKQDTGRGAQAQREIIGRA